MYGLARFEEILHENRINGQQGVFSICSSHREVLAAAVEHAVKNDSFLLVESTSNQVDQYGGYTGMIPEDFVSKVGAIAQEGELSFDRILFGGDHLGPNRWRGENSEAAMNKSEVLVSAYVKAGYKKIHLDASMPCAGDDPILDDKIVAERAARLCRAAENAWNGFGTGDPPVYIIGTEVPVPGGSLESEIPQVTSIENFQNTYEITRSVFSRFGLGDVWPRIRAVVVQPGVEFSDDRVHEYIPSEARQLSKAILGFPNVVFEAHSTDYQSPGALRSLVDDHFAILKVGPWLTYAYREAVFSLCRMEEELFREKQRSGLRRVIEDSMMANPEYWKGYYKADTEDEAKYKRSFSFSDRIRYYWNTGSIENSLKRLMENMKGPVPISLISQYMPEAYKAVKDGLLHPDGVSLSRFHVSQVLDIYAEACGNVMDLNSRHTA